MIQNGRIGQDVREILSEYLELSNIDAEINGVTSFHSMIALYIQIESVLMTNTNSLSNSCS